MLLKLLLFVSLSSVVAANSLSTEQLALSKQIAGVLQSGDVSAYKKLIHSKCTLDEARIQSTTMNLWTSRYQVRFKSVKESFDLDKMKFEVVPDYVLEFQVWTKVSDPKQIKLMNGATEIELIKAFPVAKDGTSLKILEWPCFGPK